MKPYDLIISKNLLHAGEVYYYGNRGVRGIEIKGWLDFKEMVRQKNEVVKRLLARTSCGGSENGQ